MKSDGGWLIVKRAMDFTMALMAIAVLSPLLGLVGLIIRAKMGSPVLFSQQRPGLHGKPFTFYKFRTMTNEVDRHGNLLPDDWRITRLGLFFRKTTIDELPALFNVLKGDMSIVGPRPLLMKYLPLYTREQARRHEVRPGLTGWAVVNGRNSLSWEEKFAFDVWYVDNRNFWVDIKIIWKTVILIFSRKGVAASGSSTMPPFLGSTKEDEKT